jgi:hypothetical protein
MNNLYLSFEDVKKKHPDEWVLLGDPKIENTQVIGGIVVFHSKDKKEVCYLGKDKVADFSTVTIAFAGTIKQNRKIGILRKL